MTAAGPLDINWDDEESDAAATRFDPDQWERDQRGIAPDPIADALDSVGVPVPDLEGKTLEDWAGDNPGAEYRAAFDRREAERKGAEAGREERLAEERRVAARKS